LRSFIFLSYTPAISVKNLDLATPKPCHIQDIPRSFSLPSLDTLGSFVFELCSKY